VSNLYNGAITLGIGGLTNGETVLVERFIDVNTNNAINAIDVRMDTATLVDGQAAVIGGVTNLNQPGDLNPTGGVISAEFAFQGVDLQRLVGRHIFRVSSPTGRFTPVTTVLRVTNSALAQSVIGRVRSSGTNVPYGLVALLRGDGEGGLVSGTAANTNGQFTIRVPPGFYRLVGVKRGYVADFLNAPAITLAAGATVSNNAVLLPAPRSISGRIVDEANTNIGLAGVQLFVSSSNSLFAMSFTDVDGAFSVPVTASSWDLEADHKSLGQIGYVGLYDDPTVNTSTGNVSGVRISLPRATALIHGRVRTAADAPIENIEVSSDSDNILRARRESDAMGRYALGVTAGDWYVGLNTRSLSAAGYLGMGTATNLNVEDGQAVAVDFVARPFTAWLTGTLLDETGAALSDLQLQASDFAGSYSSGVTDANGRFTLGVVDGTWHLQLEGSDDEPALFAYSEMSFEVQDGVTVSNIEYRVLRATNCIAGYVRDEMSNGVPDIELYAWADIGGTTYRTSRGWTDSGGYYAINVSTGTWHVGVECFRVQDRGFACPSMQNILISSPKTNVSFTLLPRSNDPSVLGLAERLTNGHFRFHLDGPNGWQYQVQVSDDLMNWSPLDTNPLNPPVDVVDPSATPPRRFYRVMRTGQ